MSKRYPWAKWTLPAVVDPPDRLCFTIPVPDDPLHIAAFRGALLALASATKWQDDDAHTAKAVALVWREIYDLVVACEPCQPNIESWDEDMTALCEALRFQNGKLQGLCCGVWTDITGQPAQGFAPGASGTSTPPAAGGCSDYAAAISGNGYYYTLFTVNTGDTIAITNARGATYNPVTGTWYCPDGSAFFAGACFASTQVAAGNPMPAVLTGKLIAKIGATFYDVNTGGTFVVPAGITNQPVQFQFNYASIASSSGDVTFNIHYCNNAAATWSHTLNLATVNGHFVGFPYATEVGSIYVPGSGWTANQTRSNDGSATRRYTVNTIQYDWTTSTQINSIQYNYNITFGGNAGGSARTVTIQKIVGGVSTNLVTAATAAGAGQSQQYLTPTAMNGLRIAQTIDDAGAGNVGGGSGLIYQVVVTGQGFDPWA